MIGGSETAIVDTNSLDDGIENLREAAPNMPPYSTTLLIQEFNNLKRSGTPSRFLFLRDGSWIDFPRELFEVLRDGFVAGRTAFEVPIGSSSYGFDFLRMTRVDLESGARDPIAWIDVDGRCFFPRIDVDEHGTSPCPKLEIEIRLDKGPSPAAVYSPEFGFDKRREEYLRIFHQERSDESPEVSTTVALDQPRWPGTKVLNNDNRCYKVVAKLFLAGMRRFDPNTTITSIHKCSYDAGPLWNSRLKAFQMQIQATKAARGRENLKFGWYSTSTDDLAVIVSHGFGQTNSRLLGSHAYGIGVHLSPPHSPYTSCVSSENGEGHIALCRVIMGRMEKVEAGSHQYHPSSDEFDSGVDDLVNPKWYIVWSTHMNTHIIPEYIVSFESSKQSQGPRRLMISSTKRPPASSMSFSKLLAEIVRSLPSSTRDLEITYHQYRGGKISKETFISYLRSFVGDKLLTSTIRRIRGY